METTKTKQFDFRSFGFGLSDYIRDNEIHAEVNSFHQDGDRVVQVSFDSEVDQDSFDFDGYIYDEVLKIYNMDDKSYGVFKFYQDGKYKTNIRFYGPLI